MRVYEITISKDAGDDGRSFDALLGSGQYQSVSVFCQCLCLTHVIQQGKRFRRRGAEPPSTRSRHRPQ